MNNTILHGKQLTRKVPNFAYFFVKKKNKKSKADEGETNYVITDIKYSTMKLNA
jgi:hypothetical protein